MLFLFSLTGRRRCADGLHGDIMWQRQLTLRSKSCPEWLTEPIKQRGEYTPLIKYIGSVHKSSVILKGNLVPVVEAVKRPKCPIWPKHMWAVNGAYGWHVYLCTHSTNLPHRGEQGRLIHQRISSGITSEDDRATASWEAFSRSTGQTALSSR